MKIVDIKDITELYLKNDNDNITYNVYSKLTIFDYNRNNSKEVIINLLSSDSEVNYHYSSINEDNNSFKITINHLYSSTISNIYNHIINKGNKEFVLNVSGIIEKESNKCLCNQENQIINLKNGNGKILPNLLIDNYDVSSSHSAYIGSFKEESIYYLMSRGIRKEKCIQLLMRSFLINNGDEKNNVVKDYIKFLGDNNG